MLAVIVVVVLAGAALIAALSPKRPEPLPPVDRQADEAGAPW